MELRAVDSPAGKNGEVGRAAASFSNIPAVSTVSSNWNPGQRRRRTFNSYRIVVEAG